MKSILPLFLLFLISASQSSAVNYYFDPVNGNNSYSGREPDSAWVSVGKIQSRALAGDTIFFRGGLYINQKIRLDSTGYEDNWIVFKNYINEVPVFTDVTLWAAFRNKAYIIIEGITVDGHATADTTLIAATVRLYASHHIIIRNCTMKHTLSEMMYVADTCYQIKILDNFMGYAGLEGGIYGLVKILKGSHHCLIQGNYFTDGTHGLVTIDPPGENNIIRNNVMVNTLWRQMQSTSARSLVENNIMRDGRRADGTRMADAIKMRTSFNIFRRNIISHHAADVINFGPPNEPERPIEYCRKNKMYHNIMFSNDEAALLFYTTKAANPVDSNEFVNNISYHNGIVKGYHYAVSIAPNTDVSDNFCFNNIFYQGDSTSGEHKYIKTTAYGLNTVDWYQQNHSVFFKDNIIQDPLFVDTATGDFNLLPGSPGIDAGRFLTTTVGTGTGTVLPVKDAGYFCDGFGLINGDTIQLEGKTNTAQVVSVDYDNNILTLDKSLAWSASQGVALAYSGTAPDIGAFEYENPTQTTFGGKNNSWMEPIRILYPNPFKNESKIQLYLAQTEQVTLKIADIQGNEKIILLKKELKSGFNSIPFNRDDFSGGIYFLMYQIRNTFYTKKMILFD